MNVTELLGMATADLIIISLQSAFYDTNGPVSVDGIKSSASAFIAARDVTKNPLYEILQQGIQHHADMIDQAFNSGLNAMVTMGILEKADEGFILTEQGIEGREAAMERLTEAFKTSFPGQPIPLEYEGFRLKPSKGTVSNTIH